MDIGRSFSYVFEDENWIMKLILGGIIAAIPVVNFAMLGYMVVVIRNVRDGKDVPLPEWSNFGEYFMDGLKIFAGFLLYALPLIVIACLYGGVVGGAQELVNSSDVEGVIAVAAICLNCVMLIFGLLIGFLYPAILARYAEVGEISAMLKIGEVIAFARENMSNYLIVWLLIMFVVPIISSLGVIACVVGVIITTWYGYLISAHLIGQLLKDSTLV